MLRYKRITLENIVYYENATLDLDRAGITVIMGENRNATLAERRNGAGKTLLVAPIPHLKFGDPQLSTQKRTVKHVLLDQPGSSITWELAVGDVDYSIRKYRKGSKVEWKIERDGEDLEARTPTIAEAIANDIIPLNEEEFYTTVYLDSRRQSVFQIGSAANRSNYFLDLFRLHDFETVRKYFLSQLEELADVKSKHEAYLESLTPVAWVVKADADAMRKTVAEASERRKRVNSELESLRGQLEDRKVAEQYGGLIKVADRYDKARAREVESALDAWKSYERYERDLADYERDVTELAEQVDQALKLLKLMDHPREIAAEPKRVKHLVQAVEREIETLDRQQREVDRARSKHESNTERLTDLRAQRERYENKRRKFKKLSKPDVKIGKLEASIESLESRARVLENHTGTECETCGSTLDPKSAAKELKRVRAEIDKAQQSISDAREYDRAERELDRLWDDDRTNELAKLEKRSADYREPKDDYRSARKSLANIALRPVRAVEKVARPDRDAKTLKRERRDLDEARDAFNQIKGLREQIERGLAVKTDRDRLKSQIRKRERALEVALRSGIEAEKQLERYTSDLEVYESIQDKITRGRRKMRDWPIWESLAEAYGSKGLRVLVMQNLADKIAENLNSFSYLLFPEPFTFEINVDVNVFDVVVTRKDGKTSDVRHMSGAESRAFSLLWMIAVLPLIPEARRSNVVVLDEAEAGMDKVTRDLVIEQYLPKLNTVVEHVVFVTPNKIAPAPGRDVLVAVKEGSTTTLQPYEEVFA